MPGNDVYKEGPAEGPKGCWPSCAGRVMHQVKSLLGVDVLISKVDVFLSKDEDDGLLNIPALRLACEHGTVFFARRMASEELGAGS